MKKAALSVLTMVLCLGLNAQNLDKIKELLKAKKIPEAKTQIDQFLANEKNVKNAEAWYNKSKIYSEVAADKTLLAATPDARMQSFEALKKYVALDDKQQILLQLDNYKPIMDAYQGYFKDGAELYNAGKYKEALPNFKNCLSVSEYMYSKKWSTVAMDTSVVLYAGICSEKADLRDEAAIYYGKLADAKVNGEGMVEIYKWLADYYNQKKDAANTAKYIALGKSVYPADPFWDIMEMDIARNAGDKSTLYAKYEDAIAKNPADFSNRYNYAIELYGDAYKPNITERPANSAEMITKSEQQLRKVLELKPDYPQANLVLGQLLYNQAIDLNNEAKAIKVVAPATKLKPEDQKKKDDLKAQVSKKFDESIPYFEKVDQVLSPQPKLKMDEKGFLKDALDLLITIYDQKGNKEKVKVYEDKFNNVDKSH